MPRERTPLEDRFWARVRKSDGCWEWTGSCSGRGYGTICEGGRRGRSLATHRLSYELHHGPIGDGLFVCHHCDNPKCVRPEHLFVGTNGDNQRDASAKGKHPRNNRNGAKLDVERVRAIRERLANGEQQWPIAAEFGISQSTVSLIATRGRWGGD